MSAPAASSRLNDPQSYVLTCFRAKLEKNRARIPDHSICATFCYGINVRLLSVCIDYWESTSVSNAEEGADLKLLLFRMAGKATTDLPLRPHIDSASRP